jgi:hypothetical protein
MRSAAKSMTLIRGTTILGCIDLTCIQSLSKQHSLNMGMIGSKPSFKGISQNKQIAMKDRRGPINRRWVR